MRHSILLLILFSITCTTTIFSQEKNRRSYVMVKGKVTDHNENTIRGVHIFIDMVKTEVKTNKKGEYKIKIAPKENLLSIYHERYGFINWKYNGEKKVNFMYPKKTDALTQEEMEELGFNFKVKEKNWYSGFNSITDILDSKFTNVRVTNGQIIVGRSGATTVSGDARPLILVNDIPTPVSQIDVIPTTEVYSIRVLDKAADTGAYGFQGVNGVIIIKLKTGETDLAKK